MATYREAQIELIAGLEVALANVQSQRSTINNMNIWGDDGAKGAMLAMDVIEESLTTRLRLAKACKEQ